MTRGAAHHRHDGARLGGARGDERAQDHHALRHRPGGAGAAGGHPARPRLPARRRRLSHGGRAGPALADRGDPQGRAAAGGARHARRRCSWSRPTTGSAAASSSPAATSTRSAAGCAITQPDLHRHHPRRGQLPLHRRRWSSPTRRRRSGRAITALARRDRRCATGRWSTVERRRPATSTSRPSGSTSPATSGSTPRTATASRAEQVDARPARRLARSPATRSRAPGRSGGSTPAACASRRRRRAARRAGFLSETASGWYTIRRTPE